MCPAYSSPVRAHQARATRRAIVAAAAELFVERGYAATTIDAIAERAGVGRKTVFSSVGGKGALLKEAWDWALVGDDEPIPMSERPAVRAIIAEPDPRRMVRLWVDMVLDVGVRIIPLGAVVLAAADADAEARALNDLIHRESLDGATAFVANLTDATDLRPGLTRERAADLCWALLNSRLLPLLTENRGWTRDEYGRWLAEIVTASLLEDPADTRSPARAAPVHVTHAPERQRYEASVGTRDAGHLSYERTDHLLILTRTEFDPAAGGAVADALMRAAIDDVRRDAETNAGRRVVALCPYAEWWLSRHPDVESLVHAP